MATLLRDLLPIIIRPLFGFVNSFFKKIFKILKNLSTNIDKEKNALYSSG